MMLHRWEVRLYIYDYIRNYPHVTLNASPSSYIEGYYHPIKIVRFPKFLRVPFTHP